jgi:hypothetical protein
MFYKKPLFIFAIIPFASLLFALLLKSALGPYWLGSNSDPEYVYLLNSLNFAEGRQPGHVDHPGTPLQIAGAFILRSFHFFRNHSPLAEDVLKNPETYLRLMNGIFLFLAVLLIFLTGWFAFKKTSDKRFSFLVQLSFFFLRKFSYPQRV